METQINSHFGDFFAIIGTSGCGKTRTIFEYLSKNYGFFFTMNEKNSYIPGSYDFQKFIEKVEKTVSDNNEDNQQYLNQFIKCLFLSRLCLFEFFLKNVQDFDEELWLYCQLFPERVFKITENENDIFLLLTDILKNLERVDLENLLKEKMDYFKNHTKQVAVFVVIFTNF